MQNAIHHIAAILTLYIVAISCIIFTDYRAESINNHALLNSDSVRYRLAMSINDDHSIVEYNLTKADCDMLLNSENQLFSEFGPDYTKRYSISFECLAML